MHIRIIQDIVYRYTPPARSVIYSLRLTPRSHDGQHISSWRIDVDADGRMRPFEDAFGNLSHQLTLDGPLDVVNLRVEGDIETWDTAGVVRGVPERLPLMAFLRETELTASDAAITAFAHTAAEKASGPLNAMHLLMGAIHERIKLVPTPSKTVNGAGQTLLIGSGSASDVAHLFIACARCLGQPARFVTGYCADAGENDHIVCHSWAEAHVDGYGWIGFDAVRDICPATDSVRLATGFDHVGASPMRASRSGFGDDELTVRLRVAAG